MKIATLIALAAACSSGSNSPSPSTDSKGSGVSGATFPLGGTVSNPVSQAQTGRLIVGVAHPADVPNKVICSRFLAVSDQASVTLPAQYTLEHVPQGTLILAAILIDGSQSTLVPGGTYQITVDAAGVEYNAFPTDRIDIHFQGTIADDCQ